MFLLPDVLHPFHQSGPESHCSDVQSKSGDREVIESINFLKCYLERMVLVPMRNAIL